MRESGSRLLWLGFVLALVVSALPTTAKALPLLGHEGRWLTDPKGRVVILHGVQIDKWRPDHPVNIIDLSRRHVRFIAAEGFNVARVSMTYSGVEPQMGSFDESYIDSYLAFDRRLARAGVYNLLDMMQGQYSEAVGGWGFPDWMTLTDGAPNNREPFGRGYLINPAQYTTWDNFWSNAQGGDGVGLQDRYAAGLRHLGTRFADAPALLGIEILNEPWPGSAWPSCANPSGCPPGGFDQTSFTDFYRRMMPALRSADSDHLIVYEPNLLFDFGASTGLGSVGDDNVVFAFHNYCLGRAPGLTYFPDPVEACGVNEEVVLDNAEARSAATGHALLMDEWGNDTDPVLNRRMAREADQHMIGWTVWAYEDCCRSPAAIIKDGTKSPSAPGNLNRSVLEALVRPYPQILAGTPSGWSFDPDSKRFRLGYSTRRVGGGVFRRRIRSRIEVPPLQYPTGYEVKAEGAKAVSAPDADPLLLRARRGSSTVQVTVTPARHHPSAGGLPGKCLKRTKRVRLPSRSHGRIVKARLYVNGRRVKKGNVGNPRRPRFPGGLTNGSRIRIVAATSQQVKLVARGRIHRCRIKGMRVRTRS